MNFFPIKKTPVRLQTDPLECGAICLGIILEYYGRYEQNHTLKTKAKISRDGTNALNIISAANYFNLDAKALRFTSSEVKKAETPSIIFFDQCHFVVYEGFFNNRFFINDPALGRYSLKQSEFMKRFSAILITLNKNSNFSKVSNQPKYKLDNFKRKIFGLSALSSLFILSYFMLLGFLLSEALAKFAYDFLWLWLFLGAILALYMLIFLPMAQKIITLATKNSQSQHRDLLYGLAQVPLDYFEQRPFKLFKQAFINAFSSNLELYQKQTLQIFLAIQIFTILLAMFIIWPPIFCFLLFFCLLISFYQILSWRKTQEQVLKEQNHYDILATSLANARLSFKDLQSMGQSELLIDRMFKEELLIIQQSTSRSWLTDYLTPICLCLFFLIFCFLSLGEIQNASLSSGELISSLMLAVVALFSTNIALRPSTKTKFSIDFLNELNTEAKLLTTNHQELVLENKYLVSGSFSHSYHTAHNNLLTNIELNLEREKIYGLTGPALVGKSTFLQIIAKKTSAQISSLKWQHPIKIGIIDNDSDLVLGTLRENISLFDHNISSKKIVAALSNACVSELFLNRPLGLLAPIFAHGENISGGQKKRLLLARALLHDPDLLVLDNFFETLDNACAEAILKNIAKLKITLIFSSTDPLLLGNCHQILTLDRGELKS